MATRQADQARQQLEKNTAEIALQQQLETTSLKRLAEKMKRGAEQKQEEEQRKLAKAEKRKAEEAAVMEATVVSPTVEVDTVDPLINSHLADMMQGGAEDDAADDGKDQRFPVKSKQKEGHICRGNCVQTYIPTHGQDVKTSFDTHKHTHPQVTVEALIILTRATPVHDFILNLQEQLKTGQLIDKMFAFCPISPDRMDKKIHESSGIPTNTIMLGAHFKILSNGENPFEKQKQRDKAKKNKEEFCDPIVNCFSGNGHGQGH